MRTFDNFPASTKSKMTRLGKAGKPTMPFQTPDNFDELIAEVDQYLEDGRDIPDELANRLEEAWGPILNEWEEESNPGEMEPDNDEDD